MSYIFIFAIALVLEHIRGKGMAMTMKTTGLLLWADMHLHWADHVFKVSDREILEMLPCHSLLMLLLCYCWADSLFRV